MSLSLGFLVTLLFVVGKDASVLAASVVVGALSARAGEWRTLPRTRGRLRAGADVVFARLCYRHVRRRRLSGLRG